MLKTASFVLRCLDLVRILTLCGILGHYTAIECVDTILKKSLLRVHSVLSLFVFIWCTLSKVMLSSDNSVSSLQWIVPDHSVIYSLH